ncbi:hypothetical protein [Sodalis sp.]
MNPQRAVSRAVSPSALDVENPFTVPLTVILLCQTVNDSLLEYDFL